MIPDGKHNDRFIKFIRSQESVELLKDPNAFVLLSLIAFRAKRTNDFSIHNLKPGEALIGDLEACGLSPRQYRTAKSKLEQWGLVTFKTTNKGTIAILANTRTYDINQGENEKPSDKSATSQRQTKDKQKTSQETSQQEHLKKGFMDINGDERILNDKPSDKPGAQKTQADNQKATTNKKEEVIIKIKETRSSDEDRLKKYQEKPDCGWNSFLIAYHERFNHLPTLSNGAGRQKEFIALVNCLKKIESLGGNKGSFLECWKLYLNDPDNFLKRQGHRPTLMSRQLDHYWRNVNERISRREYNDVPAYLLG
ncbi:MAG TPA: hypothetical protein VM123_01920 [archaeon]|nr:hypothetical protein [archaeon]